MQTETMIDRRTAIKATFPNEIWLVELVRHRSGTQNEVTIVAILDVFSGRPVMVDLTSGSATHLTVKLDMAVNAFRRPIKVWVDGSFEFSSAELQEWAQQYGTTIIRGGMLQKHSQTAPFLKRLWEECLSNLPTDIGLMKSALGAWCDGYRP